MPNATIRVERETPRDTIAATIRAGRELPPHRAVDSVGERVGRAVGYLRTRRPSDMRTDLERVIAESPLLSLVAALGVGYLIGSRLRG